METLFVLFFSSLPSPIAINMWHNQVASLIQAKNGNPRRDETKNVAGRRASIFDVSAPPPPFYVAHSCQLTPSFLRQGPLCSMNPKLWRLKMVSRRRLAKAFQI